MNCMSSGQWSVDSGQGSAKCTPQLTSLNGSQPPTQKRGERGIKRVAGANERVVDGILGAQAADVVEECLHGGEVAVAERAGVTVQNVDRLQPLEARRAAEGKIELVVVHDVQNEHVMPALPQELE